LLNNDFAVLLTFKTHSVLRLFFPSPPQNAAIERFAYCSTQILTFYNFSTSVAGSFISLVVYSIGKFFFFLISLIIKMIEVDSLLNFLFYNK